MTTCNVFIGSYELPIKSEYKEREGEANRKNIIIFADFSSCQLTWLQLKMYKKMHKVCPDILLDTNALLLNCGIVNAEQHWTE